MSLRLTRRIGESIKIGSDIEIKVIAIDGPKVCLAIEAPRSTQVWRGELVPNGERRHVDVGFCWCGQHHLREETKNG